MRESPEESSRVESRWMLGVTMWLLLWSLVYTAAIWTSGHPGGFLFTNERADTQQEIWFLGFAAHAIRHGQNPFFTTLMYAGRGGVNTLANTSELAIGVLLAPVTWIFGPVLSVNLATLMAPVVTGAVTFRCLRHVTVRRFGKALAATLVAFSPGIVGAAVGGHLMLTVFVYPPIVLFLLFDLFVAKRRSPRWIGIAFALATTVQFFIGTELLAMTACTTVIGLLVAFVVNPRYRPEWERLAQAAAWAIGGTVLLLGYPLWFAVAGPQHVNGPAWPIVPFAHHAPSDILHGGLLNDNFGGTGVGGGINTAFLGMALLVVLALSIPVWRRRTATVIGIVGVLAWMLSLGDPIGATGAWAHLTHPMHFLNHITIFQGIMASRFDLVAAFCAAVLLSFSVDGWIAVVRNRPARRGPRVQRATTVVVYAVAALVLLPIFSMYALPPAAAIHEPRWFAASARHLRPSGNVLVFPNFSTLVWEAREDFPFPIMGGYAIIPGPDGQRALSMVPPSPLDDVLLRAEVAYGVQSVNLTSATLPTALETLRHRGVSTVVVLTKAPLAGVVAANFTGLFARGPRIDHGTMIWAINGSLLPKRPRPGAGPAIATCAWRWRLSANDAVRCVERHLGEPETVPGFGHIR